MGITRKAQAFQCIDLGILAANWGYNVLAQVPGSDVKARFDGLISLKKNLQLMKLQCRDFPGMLGRSPTAQGSGSVETDLRGQAAQPSTHCTPGDAPRHILCQGSLVASLEIRDSRGICCKSMVLKLECTPESPAGFLEHSPSHNYP